MHAQHIVVDHTSVALFEHIPPAYKDAAAALRLFFMDRSVGGNINDALSCLSHLHGDAPNSCTRAGHRDARYAVDPSEVYWDGEWDRSNWRYEFWPAGCSEDANCFIESVEGRIDSFDVVGFQFSYLAVMPGSKLADPTSGFFAEGGSGQAADYAAFAARHPEKTVIWWTTSLARSIGTEEAQDFNQSMRTYCRDSSLVLFDVADILSHDPAGAPCFDNRDGVTYLTENHPDDGLDLPAICPQYTTETEGGHLGSISAGGIRIAKAFWVLMARIAGWDGGVSELPDVAAILPPGIMEISISPQPVRHNLHARIRCTAVTPVQLVLYDMLGRNVLTTEGQRTGTTGAAEFHLRTNGLPGGSYLLAAFSDAAMAVRRVLILP
ncbi:hypothetical protein KQI65_09970 [bacterium]|nr:hypothetical protein [bacterium]